jgi:uncharacterized protein (TIGR02300 family)
LALANRGTKRRCASCGAAFYDLNHDPIVCPKCQAAYVPVQRLPSRAARTRNVEPVLPAVAEPGAFEEDEVLAHGDEDEDGESTIDADEGDEDELRE